MANPMDQVISKGAGLVNEVKAMMDGLVGVFKTLAEQHGEAGALLKRANADVDKRAELWPTISASLKAHEEAELREVYPVMASYPELQVFVTRHEAQATQLSQTIAQLDACNPRSERFETLLTQLLWSVEAHASEEEQQIFPMAQRVMGEERARAIEPRFVECATRIKQTKMGTGKA